MNIIIMNFFIYLCNDNFSLKITMKKRNKNSVIKIYDMYKKG